MLSKISCKIAYLKQIKPFKFFIFFSILTHVTQNLRLSISDAFLTHILLSTKVIPLRGYIVNYLGEV
jgi:hypothetical protein